MLTPITIRLTENVIEKAIKIYGAKVTGAQIAVEGFFEIQRRTVKELAGKFSEPELSAMADNLNGFIYTPEFQGSAEMFWAHLEDGEIYDGLFQKWDVDGAALKTKVLSLSAAQTFFIQDTINQFWNFGKTPKSLSELIDSINQSK